MLELRRDPIVGRFVIIAEDRGKRPRDVLPQQIAPNEKICPFCEGNEHCTPGEVAAVRPADSTPDGPGWQVRVVPNKYPALEFGDQQHDPASGLYESMSGIGTHEVIIESPRHICSTTQLSDAEFGEVLSVYRDRLIELKKDSRLVFGMIFKNVGEAAGASLEHTHSQLVAMPIVPISVQEEMTGSKAHHDCQGRCLFCEMIQQELDEKQRVVMDSPEFLAFCPFASRFPYETWILPKSHESHFEKISREFANNLAQLMRPVLKKIEHAIDRPAYNYVIHTSPFDLGELNYYHWHIEILPRTTSIAGFEWGSGFYINPLAPEKAAEILRKLR